MDDQEPLAAAGDAGSLQLDRAEYTENAPERCAACGQALDGSYYEVGGRICCPACQARIVAALAGRPGAAGFLRAAAAGLGAAAVGSAIYFAVRAAIGYPFGLISILVGFLVGKAVHWGCGGRGGWPYQALAVLLTYLAIVSTYVPVTLEVAKQQWARVTAETTAARAGNDGPMAAAAGRGQAVAAHGRAPARGGERQPASARSPADLAEMFAIAVLVATTVPFLGGVGILGLIVIAVGLYEAWKLNQRPRLTVTGPHTLVPQAWRR